MNIQHQKTISIISLLIATLVIAAPLHAGNTARSSSQKKYEAYDATQATLTGEFFGYDQKTRKIWINDYAYILSADYRVVGTSTKLGALSAIKYAEIVVFKTAPNPKHPSMPYVIEIQRK